MLNLFTDAKLRSRQDILDAQWNSLKATYGTCDQTPDAAFAEFATDYRLWKDFYDSESDWSSDSFNATNVWQDKAKEWSTRIAGWGCSGNFILSDGAQSTDYSGIPGVKDVPPDEQSLLGKAADTITGLEGSIWDRLATVGWIAVGLVVLLIGGAIYLLTHVKVSAPQGSIG